MRYAKQTIDGLMVYDSLPNPYKNYPNFPNESAKIIEIEGFLPVEESIINAGEKLGELYQDGNVYKYKIINIQAEIDAKLEQEKQSVISEQQFKKQEIVQAKITKQIEVEMNDINLPITNIIDNIDFYDYWQVDTIYGLNKVVRLIGTDQLYRCVQSHTSQADWSPKLVPALFTPIVAPGTIGDWVQPTGTHDAYNIGDQVHFPSGDPAIYESLINANTWSPTAYPAGWELI